MSMMLKGIDLPTDRKPYAIEVIYRFEGADGLFSEKNYLSPNEAIQIPKGHGRIGDLEKLAKLLSNFGESLKESATGNKLLMTERDICHAMAVLTEHFQEYEPLLEAEENE